MEKSYVFSGLKVQGHDQLPYWIRRFSLNFSNDGVEWYQHADTLGKHLPAQTVES